MESYSASRRNLSLCSAPVAIPCTCASTSCSLACASVLTRGYPSCSIHGLCCILAGCSILSQWDDRKLDHVNSELQNQVVQFSFAYLASDTLNAIFFDWDVLFLAHHVLSLLYLYAVLQLQVGAVSAVFVFFLGEITSPIFNSFTVLRELKKDYKWASPWFHFVSPIFTGVCDDW